MSEKTKGVLYVLVTVVLWGGVLPFALHVSLKFGDVSTISWFRFVFAFVCLIFILKLTKTPYPRVKKQKSFGFLVIAGILLAVNYLGYFTGVELTTPGNAQIIIQLAPLMFAVMGVMFFGERLGGRKILGFGIALLGFALFYKDQITQLVGNLDQYNTGNLAIFGGAVTWAIYAVYNKLAIRTYLPQQANFVIYFVAIICLTPLCDFSIFSDLNLNQWILFSLLGLITLVAYGTLGEALKRIPASTVSILITTNPIITLTLATIFNHFNIGWVPEEHFTFAGVVGAAFVIAGACFVVSGTKAAKKA